VALAEHICARAQRLEAPKIVQKNIHVTDDPTTIIAKMTLQGARGQLRPAIAVITVCRDYWNPLDLIGHKPHVPIAD